MKLTLTLAHVFAFAAALCASVPDAVAQPAPSPPQAGAAPAAEAAEAAYLSRWVGEWEGQGTQDGKPIRDRMSMQWLFGRRFLAFTYMALAGDGYRSQGYVWFDPLHQRYELHEFNNGVWPVRHHVGQRKGDVLRLEEKAVDRHLRLVFRFEDPDTLLMEESHVVNGVDRPYVVVRFKRQPTAR